MSRFAPLLSITSPSHSLVSSPAAASSSSFNPSSSLAGSLSAEISLKLGLGFPGLSVDPLPPNTKPVGAPKKAKLSQREVQAQRSKAKKKNQDGWDDIIKTIRAYAKEYGCTASEVINLCEQWTSTAGSSKKSGTLEKAFPPSQVIIASPIDPNHVRVLMSTLLSKATTAYQQPFFAQSKRYKGVQSVQYWGVPLGDSPAAIAAIADSLAHFPHCNKLELLDCSLSGPSAIPLSGTLKHRQTAYLRILRLDHNSNFGNEGLKTLVNALQFNSNLKILSLINCGLKGSGAGESIAKLLSIPQLGIETLTLEGNQLGNEGFQALCRGFLGSSILSSLNVKLNEISSTSAVDTFVTLLPNCSTLRKLNMDGNLLGDQGMKTLLTAAEMDPSPLSQLEEFIVSPFCSKEIYVKFSAKMDEFAAKFKKPKKKKKGIKKGQGVKSPVGANRSVFSSSAAPSAYSAVPRSPAAPASRGGHYTAAISSTATSKPK